MRLRWLMFLTMIVTLAASVAVAPSLSVLWFAIVLGGCLAFLLGRDPTGC